MMRMSICTILIPLLCSFAGCAKSKAPEPEAAGAAVTRASKSTTANPATSADEPATKSPRKRTFAPVEIAATGPADGDQKTLSAAETLEAMRGALKPLQVLLGQWNGLSQKQTDHPEWTYDWVTDPKRPGLRVRSEKGTYLRNGLLSYVPVSDQFEFSTTDAEGVQRLYRGTFIEPIRDVMSDEKKPQRTYKLQLTEAVPQTSSEQWRVTLNQQENNRYILELDRKRGAGPFIRVETVHTQRDGTSFALSDTDYGDKTCIISQGLGTMSVSYKGQSFWVCCSGCKAAFDEDPEKWIARWEVKKKSMKQ